MIIGIDPGNSGAISLLSPSGELIAIHDMPTETAGKEKKIAGVALLRAHQISFVYTDHVPVRASQAHSHLVKALDLLLESAKP